MADEKANVNSVSNIRYIVLLSLLSDPKVATGMFCDDAAAVDIRINIEAPHSIFALQLPGLGMDKV